MTTPAAARANRDGHPCPPWCAVDHETPAFEGHWYIFHGSEQTRIQVPGQARRSDDVIHVRAVHPGTRAWDDDTPQVDVSATRYGVDGPGPHAWIAPREAEHLAVIVEMLAEASPARHRELAAAIRKAAADIEEAGQ